MDKKLEYKLDKAKLVLTHILISYFSLFTITFALWISLQTLSNKIALYSVITLFIISIIGLFLLHNQLLKIYHIISKYYDELIKNEDKKRK